MGEGSGQSDIESNTEVAPVGHSASESDFKSRAMLLVSGSLRVFVQSAALMAIAVYMHDVGYRGYFRQSCAVAILCLIPVPFEGFASGVWLQETFPSLHWHLPYRAHLAPNFTGLRCSVERFQAVPAQARGALSGDSGMGESVWRASLGPDGDASDAQPFWPGPPDCDVVHEHFHRCRHSLSSFQRRSWRDHSWQMERPACFGKVKLSAGSTFFRVSSVLICRFLRLCTCSCVLFCSGDTCTCSCASMPIACHHRRIMQPGDLTQSVTV